MTHLTRLTTVLVASLAAAVALTLATADAGGNHPPSRSAHPSASEGALNGVQPT